MRISDWSSDVCSSDLIFACRPGEISILGSGGISQRAATAGANIIPAVASAKIQRQLIGDLVSDLAIKCLVLVFDVRRRERDARGIGGECNKMRTARLERFVMIIESAKYEPQAIVKGSSKYLELIGYIFSGLCGIGYRSEENTSDLQSL